jgi:hypothetical protein
MHYNAMKPDRAVSASHWRPNLNHQHHHHYYPDPSEVYVFSRASWDSTFRKRTFPTFEDKSNLRVDCPFATGRRKPTCLSFFFFFFFPLSLSFESFPFVPFDLVVTRYQSILSSAAYPYLVMLTSRPPCRAATSFLFNVPSACL